MIAKCIYMRVFWHGLNETYKKISIIRLPALYLEIRYFSILPVAAFYPSGNNWNGCLQFFVTNTWADIIHYFPYVVSKTEVFCIRSAGSHTIFKTGGHCELSNKTSEMCWIQWYRNNSTWIVASQGTVCVPSHRRIAVEDPELRLTNFWSINSVGTLVNL